MKLAISTATFFTKVLTEDAFDVIRSLGIDTCEVFLNTYYEYRSEFGDLLARRKGDMEVYSVHSLTNQFEPDLFNIAPRTRGDAEYFFDCVTATGKKLGAKYYTFHGPARLKRREYVFDYPYLAQRFKQLMERAEKSGITLAYENVHWTYFSEPLFYSELSKHLKGLSTVLDIKQAMQSGIDYRKFMEVMQDSLCNVHICDYTADKKLHAPGKGTFDFKTFFRELRSIGYDKTVVMELYSNNFNDISELSDSIKFLQDCMG